MRMMSRVAALGLLGAALPIAAAVAAVINGTSGNDRWTTTSTSADTYNGLGGDDYLSTKSLAVTFNGGAGLDTQAFVTEAINALGMNGVVLFNGASRTSLAGISATSTAYTLAADVERSVEAHYSNSADGLDFVGNRNANTILGDVDNARPNVIHGMGGADTLEGGLGADSIHRGDGNDVVAQRRVSDPGSDEGAADSLYGGNGADTLYGHVNDTLDGGDGGDVFVLG
jgi:Ca2+-binding RTX toxin-like protein